VLAVQALWLCTHLLQHKGCEGIAVLNTLLSMAVPQLLTLAVNACMLARMFCVVGGKRMLHWTCPSLATLSSLPEQKGHTQDVDDA
jgi:hypothetical protein